MTIVELPEILFSHAEMAEYGQYRIREEIATGETRTFTLPVGSNEIWFIYRYRFGDIPVNIFYFRWSNVRCAKTDEILLGTEHTNNDNLPTPFIICKGSPGQVMVRNTDVVSRYFEMTIEFLEINEMFMGKLKKMLNWSFEV